MSALRPNLAAALISLLALAFYFALLSGITHLVVKVARAAWSS